LSLLLHEDSFKTQFFAFQLLVLAKKSKMLADLIELGVVADDEIAVTRQNSKSTFALMCPRRLWW